MICLYDMYNISAVLYEGYHYLFKYNFMDIEIHENDLFENQIWTMDQFRFRF